MTTAHDQLAEPVLTGKPTTDLALLPDGLTALRDVLKVGEIMRLIEETAQWVAPETFALLPVWYPEYARRELFFKANWSEPQYNTNRITKLKEHKREGNLYANKALTHALGLRSPDRPNWSCCHIWGVDDPLYQESNAVVQDRRFYSCIANMVLLPTPLKAFTDTMADVKAMLRVCAANIYGWTCDHGSVAGSLKAVSEWTDWSAYPASWPRSLHERKPLGIMPLTPRIKRDAERRLSKSEQI